MIEQALTYPDAILCQHDDPFPASFIDRFFDWVRMLPIPSWSFYLGLWAVQYVLFCMVAWMTGVQSATAFTADSAAWALFPVYYLALMHYLDSVAEDALTTFRPVLAIGDGEYARIRYEILTMPARPVRWISGISLLLTMVMLPWTAPWLSSAGSAGDAVFTGLAGAIPPATIVGFAGTLITNSLISIFLYHTVRQIRIASRMHRLVTHISLSQRRTLYAFSTLTARTTVGYLIAILSGLAPYSGLLLTGALTIVSNVVFMVLAGITLVLPLRSIRRLVVREKRRQQSEVHRRLEHAFGELHRRVDDGTLAGIGELKTAIDTLMTERDFLQRTPAWPWQGGTIAAFASAVLLPLIVWLSQQILSHWVR